MCCNKVLFICTGNYYRSRFAEIYFNHLNNLKSLSDSPKWVADSRGLGVFHSRNPGNLSVHTLNYLEPLNLPKPSLERAPLQLQITDLKQSDRIIAIDESEHRPMMLDQFPRWANVIDYWFIHDIDKTDPRLALPVLQQHVEDLHAHLHP